jgi:hypothetical protein
VWLYWEGPRPAWIAACQRTIMEHAPGAMLLDPASFSELWDRDRDINVARWHVAHRSDFIRAFLLARHGGLWIDSDCLLMRPLDDLLERAGGTDFVAHRERSGMVSNAFIAARPGSPIAAELYRQICETLRTRQSLEWIDLGGGPLTRILSDPPGPWLDLPCRLIQPLCWSETAELFRVRAPEEHAARFDEEAICYMLSNQQVGYYRQRHPHAELLAPGTFFRYLLARASGLDARDGAGAAGTAPPADAGEAGAAGQAPASRTAS